MRPIVSVILYMMLVFVVSCGNDDNGIEPSLSDAQIIMTVGDVAEIVVADADNVSVIAGSKIIDVEVNGAVVRVTALSVGQTAVYVNADGCRLKCDVTVEPMASDNEPEQQPDKDNFANITADGTSRYISPEMSLRYDDCGIMIATENNCMTMTSLDTGDVVAFSYDGDLAEGNSVANARLTENEKVVTLSSTQVIKQNEHGVWIVAKTASGKQIILVVTDL